MCDIHDVVRKITPVFNILNPFCPRLWHLVLLYFCIKNNGDYNSLKIILKLQKRKTWKKSVI